MVLTLENTQKNTQTAELSLNERLKDTISIATDIYRNCQPDSSAYKLTDIFLDRLTEYSFDSYNETINRNSDKGQQIIDSVKGYRELTQNIIDDKRPGFEMMYPLNDAMERVINPEDV